MENLSSRPGDFRRYPTKLLTGLAMRFGLKHLLLFTTFVACLTAFAIWLRTADWDYSHVVSLDCGHGRRIHIYEDFFCDRATIPVYEVEIDGIVVIPKYSTFLWFECGDSILANHFDIQYDETMALVAITYDDDLVAIHDFDTGGGWPSANGGREVPKEIAVRLDLPISN